MSDQPAEDPATDLPELDPDTFAGDGPAGDAHPGEFASNDQSARRSSDAEDTDDTEEDR